MRICVVAELTGGVGVYGKNLVKGLTALGADVTVLTPNPELVAAGTALPARRVPGRGRWLPQALAFAVALREQRSMFDIVHFTDARLAALSTGARTRLVGTMNDYFYAITGWASSEGTKAVYHDWRARHAYYNLIRVGEQATLRRLDRIICISSAVATTVTDRYGLPASRLAVVPYGIEYGSRRAEPIAMPHPVVLFAGGNFQRKGLDVLLRSARAVLTRHPQARFVILGDSKDKRLMETRASELGVASNVDFVGQVDYATLYRYYCTADVFTMPSLLEAFGIPFLEAMHCDVPVVASDRPGPTDFLRHGDNCLMARAGDPDDLAYCLLQVLEDPELRRRLMAGGRRTSTAATIGRMATETCAVYEGAMREPRPPGRKRRAL